MVYSASNADFLPLPQDIALRWFKKSHSFYLELLKKKKKLWSDQVLLHSLLFKEKVATQEFALVVVSVCWQNGGMLYFSDFMEFRGQNMKKWHHIFMLVY